VGIAVSIAYASGTAILGIDIASPPT